MDKYIPCRWMTSFVYLRNLATSDIPISGFPGWIKGKKKYSKVELILTTDALLRTFDVNKHTKFIYVFFAGKCHTKNRDCETQTTKDCLSDIWTCFSRFFYIYFDEFYIFMTWFYLLFYIVIGLHSKCRKDWGKEAGSRENGGGLI